MQKHIKSLSTTTTGQKEYKTAKQSNIKSLQYALTERQVDIQRLCTSRKRTSRDIGVPYSVINGFN